MATTYMQERDPFATPIAGTPHSERSQAPFTPPTPGRPQHPFMQSGQREGSLDSTTDGSRVRLGPDPGYSAYAGAPAGPSNAVYGHPADANAAYVPGQPTAQRNKKRCIGIMALVGVVAVVLAVVLPVYFVVVKKHKHGASDAAASSGGSSDGNGNGDAGNGSGGGKSTVAAITGAGGSTVQTVDGGSFVYNNSFGGFWVQDPTNPFLNTAAPNSWTPPLNTSWNWGKDKIFGVNLGGWFVLEPFIVPALYQKYPGAPDEWTLATLMRADGSLESTMEDHYNTFYTEADFAQIAGAGLNWVRIPIPFWAISTWADVGQDASGAAVAEPFLQGVCWKYIVRALNWARKYGLRVNLDIHTAPGSQNGYNHSGKLGQVNFLNGPMGVANAQRMLDYIRIVVEFVSQDEYKDLIPMVGIINEALLHTIGRDQLTTFYLEAHNMIRAITGLGAGNGPYISIHDGFDGPVNWAGFLPGSDRIILDFHPYTAFDGQPNTEPIATGEDAVSAGGVWPKRACDGWGQAIKDSQTGFGFTYAGEWSNGYNDCGFFLNGVSDGHSFPGDCSPFEDASTWNASMKAGVKALALATMDATQNWFFWTWKIGPAANGVVGSPLWSYKLGLDLGWIPTDPREANGACLARGSEDPSFTGTFSAWQTGGAGAGTIVGAATQFGTWPPTSLAHVTGGVLPTYTPTAVVTTLAYTTPAPSPSATAPEFKATPTVAVGDGWTDDGDKTPAMAAVAGCVYPDAWGALTLQAPLAACTGP